MIGLSGALLAGGGGAAEYRCSDPQPYDTNEELSAWHLTQQMEEKPVTEAFQLSI